MHIVFSEAGFGSETTILTFLIIIQSRKNLSFFFFYRDSSFNNCFKASDVPSSLAQLNKRFHSSALQPLRTFTI